MVYRIYVEKKPGLDYMADALYMDIQESLGIMNLERIRIFNRYDIDKITKELFEEAVKKILSEPQLDMVYTQLPKEEYHIFAIEYLPGQYDQRADSASQCIQILSQQQRPIVKTAMVYLLYGKITSEELLQIKKYLINPVETREASMELAKSLEQKFEIPETVEVISDFIDFNPEERAKFLKERALAMDMEDLAFCQEYFKKEGRNPSITEIKMIDTYWSDHCRHTTFLTNIQKVAFEDKKLERAWERYIKIREELGRTKPVNFMDLATLGMRKLKSDGKLENLDESDEINACTIKIKVEVNGKEEDWLLLFKNETHNHPTEIEPFGGAATCIGGAIRDPLSGRSYVYAAMRVTGAADPTRPLSETLQGKLSQKKIVTTAANGYSSYGNQIGLATGLVEEIYHPGYMAKRMEIGAVIGATPEKNVRREIPQPGDLVILLGGRTGRDGCGGATGSSKAHKLESLETCGAEVQRGNAPEERKLQRLFRNPIASKMMKRCNDFGAGGVSVAIGELADGLEIDLNKVPKKYEGLDGTEIAISESQERMAVVIEKQDLEEFLKLAYSENLEATQVAVITKEPRLRMYWNGKCIVDIAREFLNSNGASKYIDILCQEAKDIQKEYKDIDFIQAMEELAMDLNVCSQRGLSERFDSTIGRGTVLMPFGGKYQRTPIQAMVHKISLESGQTDTVSFMAYGYNPFITEKDPYKGAYLGVVESVSKLISTGATPTEIYLTFQEYFERLGKEEKRWGKPLSALLGAFEAQMDLEMAAIGGKDSMSGSFEELDVPPTLVSFAVTTDSISRVISPEYKQAGNQVWALYPKYREDLPEKESLLALYQYISKQNKNWKSIYTLTYGGMAEAILKQCIGNGFGFQFEKDIPQEDIFGYFYGAFLVEVDLEMAEKLQKEKGMMELGIQIRKIGEITKEYQISYQNSKDDREYKIDFHILSELYESRLEKVYPLQIKKKLEKKGLEIETFSVKTDDFSTATIKVAKPKVLIPVFPGSNCEYDTARAVEYVGLDPEIVVIKNLSPQDITDSIHYIVDRIEKSQIIFLPGGFSGGDEPDGSAKFMISFFRNARVKEAVTKFLKEREGLMAGICNGFQALVKLGLLPFGEILDTDDTMPSLTFNTIGRHQSKIAYTRIASNHGPWLSHTKIGDIYAVAISHGEGRFLWEEDKARNLALSGQVATQYVNLEGQATMDIQYNPNGSVLAIEGLTSQDGRILGKMGHCERFEKGLFQNVPGKYEIGMFQGAKEYFV